MASKVSNLLRSFEVSEARRYSAGTKDLENAFPLGDPKTGIYYLRERVPRANLTKVTGQQIVISIANAVSRVTVSDTLKISLRSKETAVARERYRDVAAQVRRQFEAIARGVQPLTQQQITALAGLVYHGQIARVRAEPGEPATMDTVRSIFAEVASDLARQAVALEFSCQNGNQVSNVSRSLS